MTSSARREVPVGTGAPEQLFSVGGLGPVEGGYTGSMRTGPWVLTPTGRPTVGALGVLVDDVLALSVAALSESGASVSTEITVDLVRPVPADGTVLTCVGGPVTADARGAFLRGTVTTPDGTLVALATQRQRFVPAPPVFVTPPTVTGDPAAVLHGLAGAVGDDAFEVGPSPLLANPPGTTHGGMSLYLSALLADAVLLADDAVLLVGSVRIAHLRPLPVDAPVTYRCTVLHSGRSLRLAQVTTSSAAGKVFTTATLTLQA